MNSTLYFAHSRALEECDVCIFVVDAQQGLESQDVSLIALAQKQNKGMVIMVNKWDLMEKDSKTADTMKKAMLEKLAPIDYIPFHICIGPRKAADLPGNREGRGGL